MLRPRVLVAATALACALTAAPAAASVRVSTDPGLHPGFREGIEDYVIHCVPGHSIYVFIHTTGGERVAVGRHSARSGDYFVSVNRRPGGAITVRGSHRSWHMRCLPSDFPRWAYGRRRTPQAQWYLVTPIGPRVSGYVAFFDNHGTPVWWRHSSNYGPWDGKLLQNGHVAWTRYKGDPFGMRNAEAYEEHKLTGATVRTIRAAGNPTDTHDMQRMGDGHYLVITYRKRRGVDLRPYGGPNNATVYDGEIQELTPGGKVVWRWNSRDHIALSETGRWWPSLINAHPDEPADKRTYDLVHLNSVQPDGRGLIVSARHLDAVFRIDRRSGRITWKIGGTHTSKSLTVRHDPLGALPLAGQHDARLFRHTLTVFDNGTNANRPPRAVRWRIDARKRTATLLESVHDKDVSRSGFAGSARKLPNGDWVICWGGSSLVTEATASGKRVLGLFFKADHYSYRAVGIPPGQVSAKSLRRGMDAMVRAGRADRAR